MLQVVDSFFSRPSLDCSEPSEISPQFPPQVAKFSGSVQAVGAGQLGLVESSWSSDNLQGSHSWSDRQLREILP